MEINENMNVIAVAVFISAALIYEWRTGKFKNGKKTKEDWKMFGISIAALSLVQRPLIMLATFGVLTLLVPQFHESLRFMEQQWFAFTLIGFLMLEELLHGMGHFFAHSRRPKARWAQYLHALYRLGHRPHHFSGSNDGKGEVNVTQSFVEGWTWTFLMPHYWFHYITIYLGLYETFIVGMTIKGVWSVHNHVNWNYDLYFHNHRWAWVRKAMWCLCHVFTFPTQHQHHHARGANSAKNMTNFLALYDWLVFKTLVIEKERPKTFGWRQSEQEERDVLHRFFNTGNLKQYVR